MTNTDERATRDDDASESIQGADVAPTIATQMGRLIAVLERIADRLDRTDEREARDVGLARWAAGDGPHPDAKHTS